MTRRAIDLGYGWTKFSTGDVTRTDERMDVQVDAFQSVPFPKPVFVDTSGMARGPRLWQVRVDGFDYCVSDAPAMVAPNALHRVRGENYVTTSQYEVCMAAAVKAMEVTRLDVLVVGTPVGNYEQARAALVERFGQGISFDERRVEIGSLRVIVQPVGGLIWHFLSTQRARAIEGVDRLLVDVGYGTLDWVVATGLVVNPSCSGSASYGVSSFLDDAYREVRGGAPGIEQGSTLMEGLDRLLVRGNELFYRGRTWQRQDFAGIAEARAQQAVQLILSKVGDTGTLRSVVLMGGGAPLLQSALAKALKPIDVEVIANARYANIKGFQAIAQRP